MKQILKRRSIAVLKELILCFYVVMVLLMMDRSLENIYPFFLYATGKRIIDLWIAFEMHMHVWLKWIIPAVFVIWLFRNRFRVRLGLLLPVAGVYAVVLITTCLTCGVTFRWWNTTELPLMMYLFVTVQCSTRRGTCRLAFAGNVLYSLLLLLNAVFIFFPQLYQVISGWEPEYFLSADNLTGFPMAFGLLLAYLDGHYNAENGPGAKIRMTVYYVLFFLNLILIRCAGAMIGCLFITLYLVFPFVRKLFEKWDFNWFTALSVLMCVVFVAIACAAFSGEDAPLWMYVLTTSKRSIMIRLILWSGIFREILVHPLLGYGLGEDAAFYLRPQTSLYYNAHNAYLQTLHEGGAVALAAVFAVLVLFASVLRKCRDRELAGFLAALMFSVLVMMQSAITSWFTWYPALIIIQIASLICPEEKSLEAA